MEIQLFKAYGGVVPLIPQNRRVASRRDAFLFVQAATKMASQKVRPAALRRFFRTSTYLMHAFDPEKPPGLAGRNFCLAIHKVLQDHQRKGSKKGLRLRRACLPRVFSGFDRRRWLGIRLVLLCTADGAYPSSAPPWILCRRCKDQYRPALKKLAE